MSVSLVSSRSKRAKEPVYAVCPSCYAIREDELTQPCQMCHPPKFARVRFATYEAAKDFVNRKLGQANVASIRKSA